jgi:hypothetical protein
MYRNGCIETVESSFLNYRPKSIPSLDFERGLLGALSGYLRSLKELGVDAPIFVMLSLLGVSGYTMGVSDPLGIPNEVVERDILAVPEIAIDGFDSDIAALMKPALDAVWNAAGEPGSRYYDGVKWVGVPGRGA